MMKEEKIITKRRKWYFNYELYVGGSALIVSVVALALGIYEANLERAHQRASVWPRLELNRNYDDISSKLTYTIANNGLGPAIIKSSTLSVNGKVVDNWDEVLFSLYCKRYQRSTRKIGNSVLPPTTTLTMLQTRDPDLFALGYRQFSEKDVQLSIAICYCSVFDECWLTDRNNNPTKVEACSTIPSNRD